jgi:hypothetical protein
VTIFNSQGALIHEQDFDQHKINSPHQIDVSTLANGIYEAVLTDSIGERVVRFLKE